MANQLSNPQEDLKILKTLNTDETPAGEATREVMSRMLGKDTKSLYEELLAKATADPTPVENIANIAGGLGSGASSPQTMAVLNNPAASGINNALRFAKGFAENVQKGMSRPSYKDVIDAQKLSAGGGTADFQKFKKDFDESTKTYRTVQEGWNKVAVAAKNPSAAGDVALIFGFMKTIDPGSTVREGEFATVEQARGVPDAIVAKYNQLLKGERLNNTQREDYANKAFAAYGTYKKQYDLVLNQHKQIINKFGIDPLAITPYEQTAEKKLTVKDFESARKVAQPEVDAYVKKLQAALAKATKQEDKDALQNRINELTAR